MLRLGSAQHYVHACEDVFANMSAVLVLSRCYHIHDNKFATHVVSTKHRIPTNDLSQVSYVHN
jgi:hypothetical protein